MKSKPRISESYKIHKIKYRPGQSLPVRPRVEQPQHTHFPPRLLTCWVMGQELPGMLLGDGQRVNIPNSFRNEQGNMNTNAEGTKNEKKVQRITLCQ